RHPRAVGDGADRGRARARAGAHRQRRARGVDATGDAAAAARVVAGVVARAEVQRAGAVERGADRDAVVALLEVEVRAGRAAGRADAADVLALRYVLADADELRR